MNILISGVGGQGALLTAKIIGAAAMAKGYDVKVSEIHGMSQRGGSVETYVRYGKEPISSPIIDKGCADIVLGFEALEALRAISFLKKTGKMIMNTQQINPMPVIIGKAEYPENIPSKLEDMGVNILAVDVGKSKTANVTMLGVISELLKELDLKSAIKECVKTEFLDINIKAFEEGKQLGTILE